ncbi:MAG: hypothetical protein LQ350_007939 [Teloschistes chrysophthalmus]|nr:MAG: hypothetical protein LQ350_007939 [Niorma chrysophthalma]
MRSTNEAPAFSEGALYESEGSDEEETPAQQAEDHANRETLLREGQQARVEQFKEAVVPKLAQQCYNDTKVIRAFQAIWKKPANSDMAKQRLSTVNEAIKDIISRAELKDDVNRPSLVAKYKLPIDEFITFATEARKVLLAVSSGFSEQFVRETGINKAKARIFMTQNVPAFAISLAEKEMPWGKYVGQDILVLIDRLTEDERQTVLNAFQEFFKAKGMQPQQLDDQKRLLYYGNGSLANALAKSTSLPPAEESRANQRHTRPLPVLPELTPTAVSLSTSVEGIPETADADTLSPPAEDLTTQGYSIAVNQDGRTFLGKVHYVIKVGEKGARVIVNEGTEKRAYFSVHPGAEFGAGVARDWLASEQFGGQLDPSQLQRKDLTHVLGYVDVERTVTQLKRSQRPIRIYRIKVRLDTDVDMVTGMSEGVKDIWLTRHHLLRLMGRREFKGFEIIERKIGNKQDAARQYLARCKEQGLHPDTLQKLTNSECEAMPWLSDVQGFSEDDGTDNEDKASEDDGDL